MTVWQCRDKIVRVDRPLVMGILNVTPDSFFDGGQYMDVAGALDRALTMEAQGAAVLDIGAQSTRPGASPLSAEEEWRRLAPVLEALVGRVTVPLSVDTFEPAVARRALDYGADIINDVSGSLRNDMPSLCAAYGAGLVAMARDAHTVDDVTAYFDTIRAVAAESGLSIEALCFDMGIGFHTDRAVDLALIRHTSTLVQAAGGRPLLCGASRKRVVAFAGGACDASERLGGSIALHLAAAQGGATVIRAHDVAETVQALAVYHRLQTLT